MVCAMSVTSFNGPAGLCLLPFAALYLDNMVIVCLPEDERRLRR